MGTPIVEALNHVGVNEINEYTQYLLDQNLQSEVLLPGSEQIDKSTFNMHAFQEDNTKVMQWFEKLNSNFQQWLDEHNANPVKIHATGSRSFGASYEESDLECAIVSDSFEDFLNLCRFLNDTYGAEHSFIAIKTRAGLPLLIVKGRSTNEENADTSFHCPELTKIYPGKTLCHLEVTFRKENVHEIIQTAGKNFFEGLNQEQLQSYVFNKRYIELLDRNASTAQEFNGIPYKKEFLLPMKSSLSAPLKCLPEGVLQETPNFNKTVLERELSKAQRDSQLRNQEYSLFQPKKEAELPDTHKSAPSKRFKN